MTPSPRNPGPRPSSPDHSHRDALPSGPVRGRGSNLNPGNRFESVRLHVLGDHLDELALANPNGTQLCTQVLTDTSRTIINRVDSPDIHFNWTINPYRGCEHGCIYCYARPGHEYLSLSCGLDFETKILAKHDAPFLLRRELARWRHRGETIVMSGVTDPYQPIERELQITRRCLEVLRDFRQPVSLITKNKLILRDLDIFKDMLALSPDSQRARSASEGQVPDSLQCGALNSSLLRSPSRPLIRCGVSLTTLDNRLASKMEPRASSPRERLETIRALADAGIQVAAMTAPIIPGLNDREIPALLKAAKDAGATSAGWIMLRLPRQIKDLFTEWLARHFPDRAAHIESLIRQTRSGELYDSRPFIRQRGEGEIASQIAQTFKVFSKKYGLAEPTREYKAGLHKSDSQSDEMQASGQLQLF